MDKRYVLDTSAIFTYTKDEDGSDVVESSLIRARKGKCSVYICFITLMELYYTAWQTKSEDAAKELIILVKSLPLEIINSSESLTLAAGRIKANYKLSVADAFVAATALSKDAVLVHKDPEFENMADSITTIKLPYKAHR